MRATYSYDFTDRRMLVFTHTPDERFAPQFARMSHEELQRHVDAPPLPAWPGESEPQPPKQLDLF